MTCQLCRAREKQRVGLWCNQCSEAWYRSTSCDGSVHGMVMWGAGRAWRFARKRITELERELARREVQS